MSELEVTKNLPTLLQIEIRPERGSRWFWFAWLVGVAVIFGNGWYILGWITLRKMPLAGIMLLFTVIMGLMGWKGWVWASRGLERLTVDPHRLTYKRDGSFMDRKYTQVTLCDISSLVVLSISISNSPETDHLRLKAKGRRLYFGRGLSKAQAQQVSELLGSALSRHAAEAGP